MRLGISGSSGFIGKWLCSRCRERGIEVIPLTRSEAIPTHGVAFDPWRDPEALGKLSTLDGIVHLAGRSIQPPWTQRAKSEIRNSRVNLTQILSERIAKVAEQRRGDVHRRPYFLASASAIGIYGSQGDSLLKETDAGPDQGRGRSGFLVDVATAWEGATAPAASAGVRVVNLRLGIVLDPSGGALQRMLVPARLGFGGRIGTGEQWFSWIGLDDAIQAIIFSIQKEAISGPVNLVSPNPVRNRELAETLGKVLRRPTLLPIPASFLRFILRDAADELFLSSVRVFPQVLLDHGFTFAHKELEPLLTEVLGKRV